MARSRWGLGSGHGGREVKSRLSWGCVSVAIRICLGETQNAAGV